MYYNDNFGGLPFDGDSYKGCIYSEKEILGMSFDGDLYKGCIYSEKGSLGIAI